MPFNGIRVRVGCDQPSITKDRIAEKNVTPQVGVGITSEIGNHYGEQNQRRCVMQQGARRGGVYIGGRVVGAKCSASVPIRTNGGIRLMWRPQRNPLPTQPP